MYGFLILFQKMTKTSLVDTLIDSPSSSTTNPNNSSLPPYMTSFHYKSHPTITPLLKLPKYLTSHPKLDTRTHIPNVPSQSNTNDDAPIPPSVSFPTSSLSVSEHATNTDTRHNHLLYPSLPHIHATKLFPQWSHRLTDDQSRPFPTQRQRWRR
jgi:hypothetical protein